MTSPSSFSVNASGAFTYSVPLAVLPGTAGMVPSLSLDYSSQNGDGLEGLGFTLSGLPAVNRCPKTLAQDGVHGGVNFDANDRFCLEGQRLVTMAVASDAVKAACNNDHPVEYRTEIDGFSRIASCGQDATSTGPLSFLVWAKTGQIMEFGTSIDSQLHPVGYIYTTGRTGPIAAISTWGIHKISDVKGNYMLVTYNCGTGSSCTDTDRVQNGQMYPLEISYTGNGAQLPYNSVQFLYGDRSDSGDPDKVAKFQAGTVATMTKQLNWVVMCTGTTMPCSSANTVRKYIIFYQWDSNSPHACCARINEILECDSVSPQHCLPPIVLHWSGDSRINYTPNFASYTNNTAHGKTTGKPNNFNADFNGDGLTDLAVLLNDSWDCTTHPNNPTPYVGTNQVGSDGWEFSPNYPPPSGPYMHVTYHHGNSDFNCTGVASFYNTKTAIVDYDGDGYSDVYEHDLDDDDNREFILHNDHNGNFIEADTTTTQNGHLWHAALPWADFDGDGRSDYTYRPGDTNSIDPFFSRGNDADGNALFVDSNSTQAVQDKDVLDAGDFDGDGCADILWLKQQSGSPEKHVFKFCNSVAFSMAGIPDLPLQNPGSRYVLGDFNGDGKTDVFKYGQGTTSALYVSTGNGFSLVRTDLPQIAMDYMPVPGDFNGDGRTDIAFVPPQSLNNNVLVYLSAPPFHADDGMDFIQVWNVPAIAGDTRGGIAGDWNSDGADDLWIQDSVSDTQYIYLFGGPHLLQQIDNGMGVSTFVTYDRINNSAGFYSKGGDASYPTQDVDGPLYVVKEVDSSNGLSGTGVTPCSLAAKTNCYVSTYSYGGLKADLKGRGLLGFSSVTITDPQTNIAQTTNYYTLFPFTGLIASQTKTCLAPACGASNVVLSSTVNCYQLPGGNCATPAAFPITGGDITRYFLPLRQTIVTKMDADGVSPLPQVETDYQFDCDTSGSNPCYGLTTEVDVTTSLGSDIAYQYTTNTYQSADLTNWFIDRLSQTGVKSKVGNSSVTRASQFTYDPATGLLTHETIEPSDTGCFYLDTQYTYDPYGNRQVATSTPKANCGSVRTAETDYDTTTYKGAFVTRTLNALGQPVYVNTYNAGFGTPTLGHDINGLGTAWSYDTFGRKASEQILNPVPNETVHNQVIFNYYLCTDTTHIPAGETCRISPQDSADAIQATFFAIATPQNASGAQNGPISIMFYDGLARALAKDTQGFDGSWIRSATEYDAKGRISRTSRPYCVGYPNPTSTLTCPASADLPKWTANSYVNPVTSLDDPLGRVQTVTNPDGSSISYTYAGVTTTQSTLVLPEQTLEQTITTKNARGLVTSVVDAKSVTTSYAYDMIGNLTKITAPGSIKTLFTYDTSYAKRKVSSTDPDTGTWSYTYDAYDQLTTQTDQKGQIAYLYYDVLGRVIRRSDSGLNANWEYDTASTGVGKLHYACVRSDAGSGCASLQSGDYLRTLSFDTLGRVAGTTVRVDSTDYPYAQNYTADDRVDTRTYPSGFAEKSLYVPTYGFRCRITDGGNPATSCSDTGGQTYWTANVRDWEGRLAVQTVPGGASGVQTIQSFDANTGRVLQIRASNDGQDDSSIANFTYAWDSVGNLQQREDGFYNVTDNYCYDPLNRLTASSLAQSPGDTCTTGTHKKTITYSSLGNITKKNDVCTGANCMAYASGAGPHALTSISGTYSGVTNPTFTYDANGNMTCELPQGTTTCDINAPRYVTWTSFNMVAAITQGAYSYAFTYGPEHDRIKKVGGMLGSLQTTTTYLNALGAMAEKDVVGVSTTWHDYIQVDGKIIAERMKFGSQVTTNYFILDHLGSVAVVTDGTPGSSTFGQVIERDSFDAWGKRRNTDGTDNATCAASSVTTHGFTNQEELDNLCMVNLNARIYEPGIGRFMSPDPMTETVYNLQVLNRYSYVGNNPLSFTDTTGLCFLGCFWNNGIFRSILAIIAAATAQEELASLELSGLESTAQLSLGQSVLNAGISGGISGYISTGRLNGALMGSLESVAFVGVHEIKADFGVNTNSWGGALTSAGMHGMVGGLFSMAAGQNFKSGFLAAGFSDLSGDDANGQGLSGADIARHAINGGIGSVLGGGKFLNGAITGAFGYLYNNCAHMGPCTAKDIPWIREEAQFCRGYDQVCIDKAEAEFEEAGGHIPHIGREFAIFGLGSMGLGFLGAEGATGAGWEWLSGLNWRGMVYGAAQAYRAISPMVGNMEAREAQVIAEEELEAEEAALPRPPQQTSGSTSIPPRYPPYRPK